MNNGILIRSAVLATAACAAFLVSLGCASEPTGTGLATAAGSSSSGSGGASSSSMSSSSTSSMVASSSSSGAGGMAMGCDPPAQPGELFELSDNPQFPPTAPVSMCNYRGDVMLLFNAAAL